MSIIYDMTSKDLKTALKCLSGEEKISCKNCAFSHYGRFACKKNVAKVALSFLSRQRAEIERKAGIIKAFTSRRGTATEKEVVARAQGITEFAERLKERTFDIVFYGEVVTASQIESLVEEMMEEQK
ncbi:MAG: hypothetical protein IJ955_05745 [Oscillospiraceae bacterium]|nr:hypothetical protein [Oscillospiraceae bacterium]